jgi:MATE family multidrug resistance protein
VPEWLQGARGFWIANSASLGVAGVGLFVYWRRVSSRHLPNVNAD